MATAASREWTVADLYEEFGPILFRRIRHDPPPGTATEADVVAIADREGRLYELIDGVLVEKAMGFKESILASWLVTYVNNFLSRKNLGIAAGEAGMMRLSIGLVRIPDVSFVSWDRLPNREIPKEPLPMLSPDLAVEVLSESNTAAEMDRKLREYFAAGVRLVWFVDLAKRTVTVYESVTKARILRIRQTLDGGDVLPGFRLPLAELFAERKPS